MSAPCFHQAISKGLWLADATREPDMGPGAVGEGSAARNIAWTKGVCPIQAAGPGTLCVPLLQVPGLFQGVKTRESPEQEG